MKSQIATLIAVGLVAGSAFAQNTTSKAPLQGTAEMPAKAGQPTEPAGGAMGNAQTSLNRPQTGPAMTSPKGAVDKGVVSTPAQVQGSTATAPEKVMHHDNKVAHPAAPVNAAGMKTHKATMDKHVDKPTSPVVLTTPAPGPVNTTPNAMPAGGTPTTKAK